MIGYLVGISLALFSGFIAMAMADNGALRPGNLRYASFLVKLGGLAAFCALPAFILAFWKFETWKVLTGSFAAALAANWLYTKNFWKPSGPGILLLCSIASIALLIIATTGS